MFRQTTTLRSVFIFVQFVICLDILAQVNLVVNGRLSATVDTSLPGLAKYNNQVLPAEIEGWKHNSCQRFYSPRFSLNNGAFIILELHYAVGELDFRVINVSGKLCKPLEKGNSYLVELYVKPIDASHFYPGLSVQFLNNLPPSVNYFSYKDVKRKCDDVSFASYVHNGYITDTINFTKISFTYTAKGGESVIHIFNSQPLCGKPLKLSKPYDAFLHGKYRAFSYSRWSEYALSSVIVTPLTDSSEACDEQIVVSGIVDTPKIQKKIFILRYDMNMEIPSEKSMLDTLCNFLRRTIHNKIHIISHTDGTGNEKHNKSLSDKRANHVSNKIRECTDAPIFIESVADNIRIEDKIQSALNRRVEVVVE